MVAEGVTDSSQHQILRMIRVINFVLPVLKGDQLSKNGQHVLGLEERALSGSSQPLVQPHPSQVLQAEGRGVPERVLECLGRVLFRVRRERPANRPDGIVPGKSLDFPEERIREVYLLSRSVPSQSRQQQLGVHGPAAIESDPSYTVSAAVEENLPTVVRDHRGVVALVFRMETKVHPGGRQELADAHPFPATHHEAGTFGHDGSVTNVEALFGGGCVLPRYSESRMQGLRMRSALLLGGDGIAGGFIESPVEELDPAVLAAIHVEGCLQQSGQSPVFSFFREEACEGVALDRERVVHLNYRANALVTASPLLGLRGAQRSA